MIHFSSRTRRFYPTVFSAVIMLLISGGMVAQTTTPPESPSTTDMDTEAKGVSAETPAGLTGLPKDLPTLTRDELVDLVKDLTLQNQMLAVKLAEQRQALANAAPVLQQRIDWQARTIERLQSKLARQDRQVAEQSDALAQAADPAADPTDLPPETSDTPVEPAAGATVETDTPPGNPADPGLWEYRFAYEYGLIRTSGSGHITLRDKEGNRQRQEFDYSEYRRDALWVNLFIRNDSPRPMRFTGLIVLQDDLPLFAKQRPLLGTHAFRTPLLQPGEVFQVREDELSVERAYKVENIELAEVQAYPTAPNPDPDPR